MKVGLNRARRNMIKRDIDKELNKKDTLAPLF